MKQVLKKYDNKITEKVEIKEGKIIIQFFVDGYRDIMQIEAETIHYSAPHLCKAVVSIFKAYKPIKHEHAITWREALDMLYWRTIFCKYLYDHYEKKED